MRGKLCSQLVLGAFATVACVLLILHAIPSGPPGMTAEPRQAASLQDRSSPASNAPALEAGRGAGEEFLPRKHKSDTREELRPPDHSPATSMGPVDALETDLSKASGFDPEAPASEMISEDIAAFSPDAPLDELLGWYFTHPDERFQIAVLETIATHAEDEQAWDLLSSALHDPRPSFRHVALTQLALLAPTRSEFGVLLLVATDDQDPSIRELATVLYGELEEQGLVPMR